MADPGHEDELEARVRRLEQRVAELEGDLATASGRTPAPSGAPTAPSAAPAPPATAVGWPPPDSTDDPLDGLRTFIADLDARFAGRALAWAGGLALILGAIYFVSLAADRGWIGPEVRIALGVVAGLASLVVGAVVMARGNRLIGHVLAPVGLAVVSISMVGATRLLDLLPVPVAMVIVLISALVAAVIAIRFDAPVVAGFGLVAVLIAPPLLGAPPDLPTLVFVGAVLVGTTVVALWKAWGWLPPLAFVLSAPQVAVWIGEEASLAVGLIGSIAYWLLQVIPAGGEALRRRRLDLPVWSAALLMGAGAFLVWCGFEVFDGDLVTLRPAFLVVVALVHFALGFAVLQRDGEGSMFGLLTAATGVAALTLAVPVQFDAPLVPVAWSAEAVAVLWVANERRHRPTFVVGGILVGLAAIAALTVVPSSRLVVGPEPVDLVDAVGAVIALGSVLVAAIALARLESDPRRRAWLWAAIGVGAVYLASVALMDAISLITAELDAEQRRTIGQTALTLLWAALGIVAFVIGLRTRSVAWRLGGLALLAVTTAKVVLVDLSDLDVAYRVVSLIGLGLVLLAGAWLWQRSREPVDADVPG